MIEFEKSGGTEKMRQVAKKDIDEASKIAKEMLTYDLPHMIRNIFKNIFRK